MEKDLRTQITYRSLIWDDIEHIAQEYDNTWSYSDVIGKKTGSILSQLSTFHYVQPATDGIVAYDNQNRFMGVCLSRVPNQPQLFDQCDEKIMQLLEQLQRLDGGAHDLIHKISVWEQLEFEMEQESNCLIEKDAEIELFLVAARSRGLGIGGKLFKHALQYFNQHNATKFFLHTDSDCDVSFYDYKGMTCVSHRDVTKIGVERATDVMAEQLYIYEGNLTEMLGAK